jgi:hypothetical protein
VIGNDRAEVDALHDRAIHVLDAESSMGHELSGYHWAVQPT